MFAGRVRFAERDARIAAAVAAGRPVTEVAAEVGLKVDTIHYICRKRGVSCRALRAPGQTPPAVSRIQQANARARALLRPVPSPVTSDRVYDGEETEFLRACEAYREGYAKKFLNATDYLFVLKQLGYRRGGVTACTSTPS